MQQCFIYNLQSINQSINQTSTCRIACLCIYLRKTTEPINNYTLLNGSDIWTIKASEARRITAAEMKYMRRTAGYTWTDYRTSAQIAKDLKITPILDKLLEYKRSWIQRVNRMPRNRIPRVMKHYCPTGRRKDYPR